MTSDAHGHTIDVDTVIVGSGFAGLGMGIRLARRGEKSFVILERASDVGGTWRDNTYPGVACDIPSHLYSFSFKPKADWSRLYARGAEIHEYLRECARSEGLLPHLRFGADVLDMRWLDDEGRWRVTTSNGVYLCRFLIMGAGRLSGKRMPATPGLDSFDGEVFHSSEWDADTDLRGKRVGVVGTGASAVQIIPAIADAAGSVVVFQRTAPYVVPRADAAYPPAEIRRFERDPAAISRLRSRLFWEAETAFAARVDTPAYRDALRSTAVAHRERQVPHAALREQLTPHYEIGCKRVLISSDFYPAMSRESVELEPSALDHVDAAGRVVASSGADYKLDVLIFATGFESTRPPFARRVFGRDGLPLADHWAAGMTAYASTVVAGFPNFFVIDGPNASLGHNSAVYMIEAQIDYVLSALDHIAVEDADTLEVSLTAEHAYVRDLDARSAATVWLGGGCDSWYVDSESRRLTLLWPDFAHAFRDRLESFEPGAYTVNRNVRTKHSATS